MYYYHDLPLLPLMFQHHRGGTCPSKPTKCKAQQLNISTYFLSKKLNAVTCNLTMLTTKSSWYFQSAYLYGIACSVILVNGLNPGVSVVHTVWSSVQFWKELLLPILTKHFQQASLITSSTDKHNSLDSEDDFWGSPNNYWQSPTTVLFRTTLAQRTTQDELLLFYFQNHQYSKDQSNVSPCQQTEPPWCPGMWFQHVWCSSRSCQPAREVENSRKENIPCELCKVSETKLTVVVSSIFIIRVG